MRTLSMVVLCIVLGYTCTQANSHDDGSADFSTGMKAYGDEDYEEALKWLIKAAEKGNDDAQFLLGIMYDSGKGMKKPNHQEAVKWYKEAAKEGHTDAQINLGVLYLEGRVEDVPKDYKKAFRLFLDAAEKGDVLAQNNLAIMYDEGKGVERNFRKADRLWLLAAQQGYSIAMENFWRKSMLMSSKDEIMYWELIQNERDNWKPKQPSYDSGSGFYITKEYILTNAHVVCSNDISSGKCDRYDEVRTPYYRLSYEKIDTDVDLALLKVISSRVDSSSANIRSGFELELGEDIAVFGYPLAEELSFEGNFTIGNISAREGRPTDFTPSNFFQFTAPIQRGNSGGPVLDAAGNVVGVVVENYRDFRDFDLSKENRDVFNMAQNINFAISLKAIKNFLKDAGIDPYSSSKALSEKDWIVWDWKEAVKKLANHPNKSAINALRRKINSLENIKKLGDERFEKSPYITGYSSYWREHIETIKDTIRQLKKEANVELESPYSSSPKKWTEVARAAEEFTVPILCFTNKE